VESDASSLAQQPDTVEYGADVLKPTYSGKNKAYARVVTTDTLYPSSDGCTGCAYGYVQSGSSLFSSSQNSATAVDIVPRLDDSHTVRPIVIPRPTLDSLGVLPLSKDARLQTPAVEVTALTDLGPATSLPVARISYLSPNQINPQDKYGMVARFLEEAAELRGQMIAPCIDVDQCRPLSGPMMDLPRSQDPEVDPDPEIYPDTVPRGWLPKPPQPDRPIIDHPSEKAAMVARVKRFKAHQQHQEYNFRAVASQNQAQIQSQPQIGLNTLDDDLDFTLESDEDFATAFDSPAFSRFGRAQSMTGFSVTPQMPSVTSSSILSSPFATQNSGLASSSILSSPFANKNIDNSHAVASDPITRAKVYGTVVPSDRYSFASDTGGNYLGSQSPLAPYAAPCQANSC